MGNSERGSPWAFHPSIDASIFVQGCILSNMVRSETLSNLRTNIE